MSHHDSSRRRSHERSRHDDRYDDRYGDRYDDRYRDGDRPRSSSNNREDRLCSRSRDRDYERSSIHRDRDRDRDRRDRREDYRPHHSDGSKADGGYIVDGDHRLSHDYQSSGDWYQHDSRGRSAESEPSAEPCSVVMVRGLNPLTTQERFIECLKVYTPVDNAHVIRDKSGQSRCFAFVNFRTVDEASNFITHHNGILDVDGNTCQLEFSRSGPSKRGTEYSGDWYCSSCNYNNFARRSECFVCASPKPVDPRLVPRDLSVGHENPPISTLVVRELNPLSTEESILRAFQTFSGVKDIRLVRDKFTRESRCFCFVEFHSVEDSTHCLNNSSLMRIDDFPVRISFARRNFVQGGPPPPRHNPGASLAAAQAAWNTTASVNPANWTPQQTLQQLSEAGYVYDESSGYYYNSSTEYYYDTSTGYYYDSTSGQYYYFDTTKQSYVPVPQEDSAAPAAPEVVAPSVGVDGKKKKKVKKDKKTKRKRKETIDEKKHNKEMAQWQRRTELLKKELAEEQRREQEAKETKAAAKAAVQAGVTPAVALSEVNSLPVGGKGAAGKTGSAASGTVGIAELAETPAGARVAHEAPQTEESSEPTLLAKFNQAPKIPESDPTVAKVATSIGNVCLLCKRKFGSPEGLQRHVEQSELHRNNLELARAKELQRERIKAASTAKRPSSGKSAVQPKKKRGKSSARGGGQAIGNRAGRGGPVSVDPNAVSPALTGGIGAKMMKAMGWKDGEGLGKSSDGQTDLVELKSLGVRAGLGSAESVDSNRHKVNAGDSYKTQALKKARARYESIAKVQLPEGS